MDAYFAPIQFGDFPGEEQEKQEADKRCASVQVLYRELKLQAFSWADLFKAKTGLASADYPSSGDGQMKTAWLQYKLNELGYLAGPLDGQKSDQLRRAIKRYSYANPGMQETDSETSQGVLAKLKSGDHGRAHLIEKPRVLTGEEPASKLVLDHNYFVVNKNALDEKYTGQGEAGIDDGHALQDAEKLDRFEALLQAKLTLVSMNDKTGSAPGIDAPLAVGPVGCEWHVFDPPETKNDLDPSLTTGVTGPTKAPAYLKKVRDTLTPAVHKDLYAMDNCPVARGGARPKDHLDMRDFFHIAGLKDVYADEIRGKMFLSLFHDDLSKSWQAGQLGTTGAIFRGSYIAGDSWIVQGRVSFAGFPNQAQLEKDHKALTGLAKSFGALTDDGDPLAARTGTMTLWRRQRVRKVVDWWSFAAAPVIAWPTVKNAFKGAFIELETPGAAVGVETIANSASKRQDYVKLMQSLATKQKNRIFEGVDGARISWTKEAIIPLEYAQQENGEALHVFSFKNAANNIINTFIGGGSFWYAMYRVPAHFLKEELDKTEPAGLTILRYDHLRPLKLPDLLNAADTLKFNDGTLALGVEDPQPVSAATYQTMSDFQNFKTGGGPSKGEDWGVVMITHPHFKQYADAFITLHEIGHCFYLTHPFDVPPPATCRPDHDQADKNCAMYYPEKNQRESEGWGLRGKAGTMPMFCGKCILKLRGWKVGEAEDAALPASS